MYMCMCRQEPFSLGMKSVFFVTFFAAALDALWHDSLKHCHMISGCLFIYFFYKTFQLNEYCRICSTEPLIMYLKMSTRNANKVPAQFFTVETEFKLR